MPRPVRIVLQVAALALVGSLVAAFAWRITTTGSASGLGDDVNAGKTPLAPGFTLPLLFGEGELSLASLRGQVVLLNFWASWCKPCQDEAPILEAGWDRWKGKGVVFVGIDAQDLEYDARKFARKYDVRYPLVYDGKGSTLGRYGVTGFPETWFVDRRGRLVGERVQGPITPEQLDRNIELALARP